MRLWIYIVSLFLPLFCGAAANPSRDVDRTDALSQPASEQQCWEHLPNRELLLTSAQGSVIAGDESGASTTVRTPNGGSVRQIAKSPFRYICDGKVTDIHHHPYLRMAIQQLSGFFSSDRYLFAVRRIRI